MVGQTITPLSPTVTGTVTTYTVSPAFPSGLAINAITGVISGTPSAPSAATTYTVTAANSGGQTAATVSVAVNDLPPVLAPANVNMTFTSGVPVHTTPVTNSGGSAQSWAISPAIPAGLTFDISDGSIDGIPTVVAAAADYLVSAQNSGGRAQLTVSIAVDSGTLLDLGHVGDIATIRVAGNRVLSNDATRWVLWNATTAGQIASGFQAFCQGPCIADPIALSGPTFAIRTANGFEVRASDDGHVTATITSPESRWALSITGAYLVATNQTGLTAWSSNGKVLFTKAGDYSEASMFAGAGEIRIANGAAAANAIEKIAVPSGTSSITPVYEGGFHSWFVDGERFLTHVGNTVWVYSTAGVQQDLKAVPTITGLGGQGDWFWTLGFPYDLMIFEVGASATARATYAFDSADSLPIPSAMTLGILQCCAPQQLTVIDLSGSSPARADYTSSFDNLRGYAALSSKHWWAAGGNGVAEVLFETTVSPDSERAFSLGRANSIAGSAQRVAVATTSGRVFYFNAKDGSLEGTLDSRSLKILLSSDGSVLEVWDYDTSNSDSSIKVMSLPAETVINTFPHPNGSSPLQDISLSGSGTVMGQIFGGYNNVTRQVSTTLGSPIWSDSPVEYGQPIRLSPDGTLIAVSDGTQRLESTATSIVRNGTLVTAVPGWALGWLDDNRLLVSRFQRFVGTRDDFAGMSIHDAVGNKLSDPPLPELHDMQPVNNDSIYSPERNTIYSLLTGNILWASPNPSSGVGAVAGSRVVFQSGQFVRTEPY
jgi:hypothetical protein